MHHVALDRSGAHQRHLDDEVVIAARPQARQHGHLCPRFDLEDAHAVGAAKHVVGGGIAFGNLVHFQASAGTLADDGKHAPDGGEHAEGEDIDLEQAERIEVVLVPLDDGALGHGGVFDRHEPGERPARDDEAADVLRQVAGKAAQGFGDPQPFADTRRFGVQPMFGKAFGQLLALVPPGQRAGQRVDLGDAEAERTPGIAQRALGAVGNQRRRQCCPLATVFFVDVGNDFGAPLVFEIDIDVGRLAAFFRDKTLEQHCRTRRVDFGDAQREADRRIGRRATPLTEDFPAARKADDVMHRQEDTPRRPSRRSAPVHARCARAPWPARRPGNAAADRARSPCAARKSVVSPAGAISSGYS